MEKISGIIPSSPRVASVDMRESSAVRPGTPSFGRPQAMSTVSAGAMKPQFDTTARTSARIQQEQLDWRSKESQQAAIAAEMSNRFFAKNRQEAGPMQTGQDVNLPMVNVSSLPVRSTPAGFKNEGPGAMFSDSRIDRTSEVEEPPTLSQPEGLFPKGSFIDRTA